MQMVHYLGHPGLSERGTSWVGRPGSLSSCVVCNVFIPNDVLEIDALAIRNIMSAFIFQFKKSKLSGSTLHLLNRGP